MKQNTENRTLYTAEKEKNSAALASIAAAVLLTSLKLAVGLATNSLGVLSEALHSGLDLLAAAITYFAVRYSSLPPDPGHPYGHGKLENLSALIESLLLLVTCLWIVYEAIQRLFFAHVSVYPSIWALGVMGISVVVDISRSRMLMRMAKKHNSQALEADALHFSTDILSSCVVIVGLICLYLSTLVPSDSPFRFWLERGDAIAALGVSLIVLKVSYNLGYRAVNVLLDAGDSALSALLEESLNKIPGVYSIESLRLRHSGPDIFVDTVISVENYLTMEEAQRLRTNIIEAVQKEKAGAMISVEFVPQKRNIQDIAARVRSIAASCALAAHSIELFDLVDYSTDNSVAGSNYTESDNSQSSGKNMPAPIQLIELHVEMPPQTSLGAAHLQVSSFESKLREELPNLIIVTHIESAKSEEKGLLLETSKQMETVVHEIIEKIPEVQDCHNIIIKSYNHSLYLSLHCRMAPETTVEKSHKTASMLERNIRNKLPELRRVTVHMEPFKAV